MKGVVGSLVLGLGLFCSAEAKPSNRLKRDSDVCPPGAPQVVISIIENITVHPIYVSTYCTETTILVIEEGLTIDVTLVPTQVITTGIVTCTKTSTITSPVSQIAQPTNAGTSTQDVVSALPEPQYSISTVYTTNVYTITSCPPTVPHCPLGNVTTETVSVSTTVCPLTDVLSTITTTNGPVGYTSTVPTTDANGSPTNVIVINDPTFAYSSVFTTGGSVGYTSTVSTTDANGSPTSVIVINIPTATYSTLTTTGGSIGYTSTVSTTDANGSPTTVVVIDEPTISQITKTGGSVGYTSTVATTDANGSPTTLVVINEPTSESSFTGAFSSITTTGGSIGYTSTVPTTDANGSSTTVVVINQPTPAFSQLTTTGGSVGYTSSVSTTDVNGSPTSVIVINVPTSSISFSSITTTGGSLGYTLTVSTTDANGSPTTVVVINQPTSTPSLSSITTNEGSVGYTSSTVPTTDGNGSPTTVVVINTPTNSPTSTTSGPSSNLGCVPPTHTGSTFILRVQTPSFQPNGPAQYLAVGGAVVTDCALAVRLYIQDGGLFNEGGTQFSTNTNFNPFALDANTYVGNISTTIDISSGVLTWTNPVFSPPNIAFCQASASGLIFAVPSVASNVPNCVFTDLIPVSLPLGCPTNVFDCPPQYVTTRITSGTVGFTSTAVTASPLATGTVIIDVPIGTPIPDGVPFILRVTTPASLRRRYGPGVQYLNPNGTVTPACSDAQQFTIQAGQMSAVSGGQISTNQINGGVAMTVTIEVGQFRDILSTGTGYLTWDNPAFADDGVRFCLTTAESGYPAATVFMVFDNIPIQGCDPISLITKALAEECPSAPNSVTLSRTTTTGGTVGLTSTVATVDSSGSPTSIVVILEPTSALSTTTYTGLIPGTSTVSTTDANGSPTSVVVVILPTSAAPSSVVLSTFTTGGSSPGTSTIGTTDANGSPTSVVVIIEPTSATPTSAVVSTITTGGALPGTTTAATTDANGSPTYVVVIIQPTSAVLSIITTSGPLAGTTTIPTTDASGSPTSVVIVTETTNALSTIVTTGGTIGATSTVGTTDANGSPTSVVVIITPTGTLIPITIFTTGASVGYTSTVGTTNADGSPTSVIIIGVPTEILSTITATGGSMGYTSTVPITDANGSPTSVVVIGVSSSSPSARLNILTTTGGPVGFTSTVSTTDANGSPTSVIIIEVPSTTQSVSLSTITTNAGSVGFTSTVLTTDANGSPTSVVVIGVPTSSSSASFSTLTTSDGSVAYTSTVLTTDANGSPTSVVVIGVPTSVISTITLTTTAGTAGYTSTVQTTDANGSPTSIVVVGVPTDLLSTTTSTGGSIPYTSTVPTTDANGSSTSVVVIGEPSGSLVTSVTSLPATASGFTTTVPPSGTVPGTVIIGTPSLTSSASPSSTTFSLSFNFGGGGAKRAAAFNGYLMYNGSVSTNCNDAALFEITNNGQMYTVGTNQAYQYSTNQRGISGLLAATTDVLPITTTWAIINDELSWKNALFSGGAAVFCYAPSYEQVFYITEPSDSSAGCSIISLSSKPNPGDTCVVTKPFLPPPETKSPPYTTITTGYTGLQPSTITQTPTSSGATGTVFIELPTTFPPGFPIRVGGSTSQPGAYLNNDGTTTMGCGNATQFFLLDGQLYNDQYAQFGTVPVAYAQIFEPQIGNSLYVTEFSIIGAQIAWNNSNFYQGYADFCKDPNTGTVQAFFKGPPNPNCLPVTLYTDYGDDGCGTVTITTSLGATASGFTSTVATPSGTVPGTVIVGVESVGFVTTTSTLAASDLPYTSTIPASGTIPGTVVIGIPSIGSTITTTITSGTIARTSTILPTGTEPAVVIIDVPCVDTPGFNYSIYDNPFIRTANTDPFTNFDPVYFSNITPLSSSSFDGSPTFTDQTSTVVTIYNESSIVLNQKAIQGEAYIYSDSDQTITISPSVFDILYAWAGPTAISGFTKEGFTSFSLGGVIPTGQSNIAGTISVTAGSYTPLRWVWASSTQSGTTTGTAMNIPIAGSVSDVTLYSNVGCSPVTPFTQPPTCRSPGFRYSVYDNPFIRISNTNPYIEFDPLYFSNASPLASNTFTGSPAFTLSTATATTIYNGTNVQLQQKAIVGEAYIYSNVDQTITIAPSVFDIIYVWAGPKALSGYTVADYTAFSVGGLIATPGVSNNPGTISVTAGSFTPLRWVWGSSLQGATSFAAMNLQISGSVDDPILFDTICPDDLVTTVDNSPVLTTISSGSGSASTTTVSGVGTALATIIVTVPTCSPVPGFKFEIFTNNFYRSSQVTPYPNFDPSTFNDSLATPLITGSSTSNIQFFVQEQTTTINIYGTTIIPNKKAIVHLFYIYSPVTQELTPSFDVYDAAFLWAGPLAYSGYTRENAVAYGVGGGVGGYVLFAPPISVVAGSYTPFRLVYGAGSDTGSGAVIAPTGQINFSLAGSVQAVTMYQSVCPDQAGPLSFAT